MRWIFLTLLMANVAYFFHGWYQQSQRVPASLELNAPAVRKGARLHLLSELPQAQLRDRAAVEPAVASPVIQESLPLDTSPEENEQGAMRAVCSSIGPFNAPVTADQLRQRLLALGFDSQVDEVKLPKAPDYWVYMAPFSERSEALREVRRLHREGLDSYVIGEGELANGISLGLFSKQSSAQKVRDQAVGLGYRVEIKIVERFDLRYWVVLPPGRQGDVSDQLWQQLSDRFSFAERREQLCADEALESVEEAAGT